MDCRPRVASYARSFNSCSYVLAQPRGWPGREFRVSGEDRFNVASLQFFNAEGPKVRQVTAQNGLIVNARIMNGGYVVQMRLRFCKGFEPLDGPLPRSR